ncbi:uncharacterized protein L969DRAFT_268969, partial [Mixia osmundae IAM 14324]|uniref:uncharacterized protein n=1 Tax=Mixia osmundae (strain CBS 9802 / IAM 14324 / JCM 22182 / KY 12970) TaxID=764103 RepID=UPI0004A55413
MAKLLGRAPSEAAASLIFEPARDDDRPDYANKTGLLPSNSNTIVEGVTTFVIASSLT